jgi:hypothetical protein
MAEANLQTNVGRRFVIVIILAFSFWMLMMVSCEESLPPRQDPHMVLRPVLRAQYVHDWNENGLRFYVELINTFDETLQDTAVFVGSVRVEMPRRPDMGRTLTVRRDSISTRRMYDPVNNIFTVDPGDTLRFLLRWDFKNDVGQSLTSFAFDYYNDTTCEGRRLAYEEVLLASGRITISRRLGEVTLSQIPIILCYKEPFIGPRDCPKAPETCTRRTS